MTAQPSGQRPGITELPPNSVGLAGGVVVFASILMMLTGLLQVMQGIGAIADDTFYVLRGNYAYDFNVTTWGWIHLIVGVIALAAGLGLLSGALWARLTAITMAVLSILINFAWLPFFPVGALVIMALNVLIIWAITKFEPY